MLPQFLGGASSKQAQQNQFTVVVVHTFDHYGVYAPRYDFYASSESNYDSNREYYDQYCDCGISRGLVYDVPSVSSHGYHDRNYEPFMPSSPGELDSTATLRPLSRGLQHENASTGTFFSGGGSSKLVSWVKDVFGGRRSRQRRCPSPSTPPQTSSHGRAVRRYTAQSTRSNPHSDSSGRRSPSPARPRSSRDHHASSRTNDGHRATQSHRKYGRRTRNDRDRY